eukprot:12222531-Karenia_brevis.AAC.1
MGIVCEQCGDIAPSWHHMWNAGIADAVATCIVMAMATCTTFLRMKELNKGTCSLQSFLHIARVIRYG